MRTSTGCRPGGGIARTARPMTCTRSLRPRRDVARRVVRIGFDPAGRAKIGVDEGTARRGPGGPDVAPGAVSRRTTVAGWPARVLTPVPAAALKASDADFTMDFIETACRITKDSIAGAAGERLKLRSWQRELIRHL